MLINKLMKPFVVGDPDDPLGGAQVAEPVEPVAPAEPVQPPLPDFNDAFVQAEIQRQAAELSAQQVSAYQAEMARQSTQYNQPQMPVLQKSQEQIRAERIQKVLGSGDWENQVATLVELMDVSRQEGQDAVRQELAPLIQHSVIQSATSQVVRHVPNIPAEVRPFIERAVDDMGFRPQDLNNPKNAQFVADAAETMARRAGAFGGNATAVQPTQPDNRGGTLFNTQPRVPVQQAAPVSTPTAKSWRDGANAEEQSAVDGMFSTYTPKGMKPEDVFSTEDIDRALRGFRRGRQEDLF